MACQGRLVEFILHIVNLAYFLSGLGILVIGALALGDPDALVGGLEYIPQILELSRVMNISGIAVGPAIYLTTLGSLVILLSIIGVGGAFKRSKPIVIIFGITTLLIMLFNIAVVMFYVLDPYFIEPTVQHNMATVHQKSFQPVSFNPSGSVVLPNEIDDPEAYAWVTMQFEESCCGVYNISDYQNQWNNSIVLPNRTVISAHVPPSCCLLKHPNQVPLTVDDFVDLQACLLTDYRTPEYTNAQGCSDYVMQLVTRYNYVYVLVATGMTGLQAIILCLTLWLLVVKSEK